MSDRASSVRPASAVGIGVGLSGLTGLAIWVMIARNFGALADILGFPGLPERASGPNAALLGIIACGAPMILWSLLIEKVHRPTASTTTSC